MNLPKELTARISDHLSKVRKNLGNLSSDEQKEILQSIEAHIYDALDSRSHGESTPALLDAVIAEMDPPESYGESDPIPDRNQSRHWKIIVPALSLIVLVGTGITLWFERPFSPVGQWVSVDFVFTPEQFDPRIRSWSGELYLKGLSFLPKGKTSRLYWTWKNGVLHHSGDNTDAKFFIKRISGGQYLFLEWVSGDVIYKKQPPEYYVLKKVDN